MNTTRRIILILLISMLMSTICLTSAFAAEGTVTGSTVRIRKEPSTKADIIANLTKNTKVEILEQEGEWYKVKYNSKEGYIHSDYLQELKEGNTNTQKLTLKKDTHLYILPTLFSSIVNTVEKDVEVNVVKKINNWSCVKYNDQEVWLLVARINEQTEQNKPEENNNNNTEDESNTTPSIGYVNVDSAYVREEPNKDSKSIDSLILNQKVQILEEIDGWYKVTLENGTGYVSKNLISESRTTSSRSLRFSRGGTILAVQENPAAQIEEKVIKTAYVNATTLNVRKSPSTSADKITTLNKKAVVKIIGESGEWYKIETTKGNGYVSKDYIVNSLKDIKITKTTTSKKTNKTSNSQKEVIREAAVSSGTGKDVASFAKTLLGSRYVYAGSGPKTFDCSGFTMYVYKQFGVKLPHNAATQSKYGKKVSKSSLQQGDLVIFNNSSNTSIGHVGIYIGNNKFIHAANSTRGVVIDSLSSAYYKARFVQAQRLI